MIGAIGRNRSAVENGVYPRISWKYCVMRNITPNIDRNTRIMPPVAGAERGVPEVLHVEHRLVDPAFPPHEEGERNRTRPANAVIGVAPVHPLSGASMSP